MNKSYLIKIISIILSVAIVLSLSVVAYADEVGEDESSSTSDVPLPESQLLAPVDDEDARAYDDALRIVANDLAVKYAAGDSTRATDYAQLIYNLLVSLSTSSYFNVYDYYANDKLNDIITDLESTSYGLIPKVSDIDDEVTLSRQYLNTIIQTLGNDTLPTSLIGILDTIASDQDAIYRFLIEMLQNTSDEGYLETIKNALSVIQTSNLNPMKNSLASIDSKIGTTNTGLTNIDSSIGSLNTLLTQFKSANHTDITNLKSSFDNIDWLTKSDSGVILRDKNFSTISSAGSYYPMYFTFTNLYANPCIYRFHIYYTENYGNTSLNLQLGTYAGGQFRPMLSDNIFYTYCASTLGYDIYVYSTGFAYTNQSINALTIKVDNGYLYQTNVIQQYIPFGSKDFNDTLVAMTNLSFAQSNRHIDNDIHGVASDVSTMNTNLDKLTRMYASDDELQAKQNQQAFESDALGSFTGSGSNAASLNDTAVIKNMGSSVKSGLTAGGGSASDALVVFGSDTGTFWTWFSQANYDAINTLYNPSANTRGLTKGASDDYSFIDDSLFSEPDGVMGFYDIDKHLDEVNYYD